MSGPKTSQYTLTPEQRAQLELQRKIRAELKLLEQQRINAADILTNAKSLVRRAQAMAREDDLASQTEASHEKLEKLLENVSRMDENSGLQPLQDACVDFEKCCLELEDQLRHLQTHIQQLESGFRKETEGKIKTGFSLDFGKLGAGRADQAAGLRKLLQTDLQQARQLHLSDELLSRLEKAEQKAEGIVDAEFLKNFRAMSVQPLLKECRAHHDCYETQSILFRRKLTLYQENCRVLEQQPREISFVPGCMEELEQLLHQTEAALAFREEQAYISRCMDEAMEELGYSLLGQREVKKRSGRTFRNALYLFDEGTAVNVTIADNGQITMELGGLDDRDRLPTQQESRALVREMDAFCVDFGKLEGILMDKGVKSRRLSILPSHEQYAQIINVSDYDMKRPVSFFRAEQGRRPAERQKERKLGE